MRYNRSVRANVRRSNRRGAWLAPSAWLWLSAVQSLPAAAQVGPPPAAERAEAGRAADPTEVERQVETLLGLGVETSIPVDAYAALGESGTRALISIFERESTPRHVRLRALSALAGLSSRDDAHATRYLLALLSAREDRMTTLGELHPARSTAVLRRTLRGLGPHAQKIASTNLVRFLAHRDARIRASAVRLLARKDEPGVTAALWAQRERERSREVLEALGDALKDRSAPPAVPRPDARGNGSPPR